MSMAILSVLQLIGIAAAYFIVILLLPWLFLRKWLAGFGSVSVRFMIYFLAGNFYIINLVYLLQFLHISCWLTLFIGTLAPFIATTFVKYRGSFPALLERQLTQVLLVLGGERGRKTLFLHMRKRRRSFWIKVSRKTGKFIKTFGLEILLVVGLTVLLLYMYGTNAVNVYGYCSSDAVLHNYWINEMGHNLIFADGVFHWIKEMGCNHIFADGVYPFGMHCLLYYLHGLFRIPVYVLLRLFYVVQTVMIHLILLAFLRSVCKSKYAPYIGIIIYIVSDRFYQYTYIRYHATLPQELGMAFILPAAYFAMAFLRERNLASKFFVPGEADAGGDPAGEAEGPASVSEDLAGRSEDPASVSEDLVSRSEESAGAEADPEKTVEDSDGTIDAGKTRRRKRKTKRKRDITVSGVYLILFAVSVSLTFSIHFYDAVITGIFCIAIGAGYCFRVFRREYFKRITAAGIAGILLAILPMGVAFVTGTPLQSSLNWGIAQLQSSASGSIQADTGNKTEEDSFTVLETVLDRMEYYVANDRETAQVIVGSIGVLFALGILWLIFRRTEYGAALVSISIYMSIMSVLQASPELGIMQILEASRYASYLGYGIPVVWSLCVDAVLFILFRKAVVLNFCSFAALAASCYVTVRTGTRAPVCVSAYETNEAVICLNNIISENKGETWTICSANDERQMIGDCQLGYHYEIINFLKDMRSIDRDTCITIPTSTVYFFIEKIPILYRDYINTEKPERPVSLEGAREPISEEPGILPYIGDSRWVTMSHMYYWAQAFKELYPNEMEVYYESDNFVCYRVKQNEYSLYNFAIDYGYNGYDNTKKD